MINVIYAHEIVYVCVCVCVGREGREERGGEREREKRGEFCGLH